MLTRRRRVVAVLSIPVVCAGVLAGSGHRAGASTNHKWRFEPSINAPWAHEGEDELDPPDAAVALCRSAPFTTPGAYAPTADTDAITGDQVNNSGASNLGCITPQNETSIAVDPTNPNHLVAGANDYRVCCDFTGLNDGSGWAYVSFDGGTTWSNVQVPGLTAQTGGKGTFAKVDSAGDPALSIGSDGTVYYANIVFSRVSPASGVAVSVSHDGGLHWDAPNMVTWVKSGDFFNDKEWIGAGPNGTVVVTWTKFFQGPHGASYLKSPIVMAASKDRGRTWINQGSPVSDASHPYNQGSIPVFGPDGSLYVAYEGSSPATDFATDATVIARSTDLGAHFQNVEVGRVYDDFDCYPIFADRQTLSDEHFRINSYPAFAVDPLTGQLAVAWADDQGAGNCGSGASALVGTSSSQVKVVRGAWGALSAPAVVTSGAGDKIFPGIAARSGKVTVTYYTRDYATTHDPATCNVKIPDNAPPGVVSTQVIDHSVCLDYAARSSSDGFASQRRLTSQGSNPFIEFADGAFIGDYTQAAVGSNGVVHAAWTDFRGRPGATRPNQDVYTASIAP